MFRRLSLPFVRGNCHSPNIDTVVSALTSSATPLATSLNSTSCYYNPLTVCSTSKRFGGFGPTNKKVQTEWHVAYPEVMEERYRDMYNSYYPYLFDHGEKMSLYPKIPSNPREWQPEQLQTFYDAIREDKYDAFIRLREKFPELYEDTRVWDNPPPFGEFNLFYSVRFGMVGVKAFTCKDYDEFGNELNLTAFWVPDNQITAQQSRGVPGTDSVVVGAMNVPPEMHPPHIAASYKANMVPVKHVCCSFKITPDAFAPIGTKLDVRHFKAGQEVNLQYQNTDYGYQGVMMRYGHDGGWVWLGDSRWQRRAGCIGAEGAKRVYPGTRMPGQTGGKRETRANKSLWRIDYKNSLIYVNCLIDADVGCYVKISDAINIRGKTLWNEHRGLPAFPTFIPDENEDLTQMATDECSIISPPLFHTFRDEHHPTSQITQSDIEDAQASKPSITTKKRYIYDTKKYVESRKKLRQAHRKSRQWKLKGLRATAVQKAEETRQKKQARFKRTK